VISSKKYSISKKKTFDQYVYVYMIHVEELFILVLHVLNIFNQF